MSTFIGPVIELSSKALYRSKHVKSLSKNSLFLSRFPIGLRKITKLVSKNESTAQENTESCNLLIFKKCKLLYVLLSSAVLIITFLIKKNVIWLSQWKNLSKSGRFEQILGVKLYLEIFNKQKITSPARHVKKYMYFIFIGIRVLVYDIKNVHNVSFLFIRNSIEYYIIVKNLRKILSRYKIFTK